MFIRINICLTEPICTCEENYLTWTVGSIPKPYLEIRCDLCGTKIVVPHEKFFARFILDTPYPKNKIVQKTEEPKSKLVVVPFEDTCDEDKK